MSTLGATEVGTEKLDSFGSDVGPDGPPKFRAACEYVRIIGTKAASEKVYLTGYFSDIDAGTYQDLTIETNKVLGEIQVVVLGIDKNTWISNAWFAAYSGVYDMNKLGEGKEKRFPCYHWINQNQSVTTTSNSSKLSRYYTKYCTIKLQMPCYGCMPQSVTYSCVSDEAKTKILSPGSTQVPLDHLLDGPLAWDWFCPSTSN